MKEKTFEQYLQEVHGKDYHGVDDDMLDSFHGWLEQLDGGEIMEYAEKFVKELNEKLSQLYELAKMNEVNSGK